MLVLRSAGIARRHAVGQLCHGAQVHPALEHCQSCQAPEAKLHHDNQSSCDGGGH